MVDKTDETANAGTPLAGTADDNAGDPWETRHLSYKPMDGSNDILRSAIIGAVLGIIFIGGGFGFATYAFGADVPAAIGIGLMTALFGGIGFGGMMGFVTKFAKYNEHTTG